MGYAGSHPVNDFAFKIGTVNGTGSTSANSLLMQAVFRMGIPVSGKNIFPSNIQGLATWYEIRVNKDGHTARTPEFDLQVAMNPATYARDIAEVVEGGYLLYDSSWPMDTSLRRDDITFLGIPLSKMCIESFQGARERILMKNIAYVGALAALLNIDMEIIKGLLEEKFAAKQTLMDSNLKAVRLGYAYAAENYDCPLSVHLESMEPDRDYVMMDGNSAAALGCVYAGATVGAWYPITPATSLMDAFKGFCHRFRTDLQTGKKKFMIVQVEDEMAAAGVVIGAGWAGARAFTSTAGPGISLMSEFIGLAYYTEIPAVFFDIQRAGPSTGMPTRTQQGDLMLCAYASHGDTKHIVLYPSDPEECFHMAVQAFDLAERFQTAVFVVSDLDIGMNDWMIPRLSWDDSYVPDRGKLLSADELAKMEAFHRYLNADDDGIPYRTLPGSHPKGAYFARGSGHDKFGEYTEDSDEYLEVMERLARKIDGAADAVPAPQIRANGDAKHAVVSVGSCNAAVLEALDYFANRGTPFDYMRIRGFPLGGAVGDFLAAHDQNFVVEQNRDGQLRTLLALETRTPPSKLQSVRFYGGLPMSCKHVVDGITCILEGRGT